MGSQDDKDKEVNSQQDKQGRQDNLINKNVSPNEDPSRSWDDTVQLNRNINKDSAAEGTTMNPDQDKRAGSGGSERTTESAG